MFREITTINKNFAIVKLEGKINEDLLNFNVIFEEDNKKILGEIEEINDNSAKIFFLGEFHDKVFFNGIIRKPSLNAKIRLINKEELAELVGFNDKRSLVLGNSPLYNDCQIRVNVDDFLSNHSAFLGSTGSGKTYGIARILQNLFNIENVIPFNSNLFIFNSTSEYDNALKDINKININFNYKLYSNNDDKEYSNANPIVIPLWLLDIDDFANLLDVTEYTQLAIIERMLSLVSSFARSDSESLKYKNHLIAKAIISVMYSNQVSAKIRDQIFTILKDCHTNELNLDYMVPGIGYTRQFRKCFDIDSQGEFVERILITSYIEKFVDNNTKWNEDYVPTYFTLDDLEVALNFALISEGLLLNEKSYAEATALKVRLHTLNNSSYSKYFNFDKYIDINDFISSIVLVGDNKRAQIINIVLENVDDRFAKTIVKIFSRILFRFSKGLTNRGSMPIHIILEEAHRYVQKDNDINILGYNIFDRISKEGRKFGLILDLITQRPTELSETVISQCSNFLIFKLNHPSDLEYIRQMIPNISSEIIEKQKSLQSGTCISFGKMMKIPLIVKMQLPNPVPQSSNAEIYNKWMIEWKK